MGTYVRDDIAISIGSAITRGQQCLARHALYLIMFGKEAHSAAADLSLTYILLLIGCMCRRPGCDWWRDVTGCCLVRRVPGLGTE